ncbi:MAG: hypothetical protein JNM83_09170 [Myxococcales bacterium]|nr:hypothetical protein [Myxococcales bacterium]
MRYHEKLFLFAEAYALNQAWLARHPDDLAVWPNYIESHLRKPVGIDGRARSATPCPRGSDS